METHYDYREPTGEQLKEVREYLKKIKNKCTLKLTKEQENRFVEDLERLNLTKTNIYKKIMTLRKKRINHHNYYWGKDHEKLKEVKTQKSKARYEKKPRKKIDREVKKCKACRVTKTVESFYGELRKSGMYYSSRCRRCRLLQIKIQKFGD